MIWSITLRLSALSKVLVLITRNCIQSMWIKVDTMALQEWMNLARKSKRMRDVLQEIQLFWSVSVHESVGVCAIFSSFHHVFMLSGENMWTQHFIPLSGEWETLFANDYIKWYRRIKLINKLVSVLPFKLECAYKLCCKKYLLYIFYKWRETLSNKVMLLEYHLKAQ